MRRKDSKAALGCSQGIAILGGSKVKILFNAFDSEMIYPFQIR